MAYTQPAPDNYNLGRTEGPNITASFLKGVADSYTKQKISETAAAQQAKMEEDKFERMRKYYEALEYQARQQGSASAATAEREKIFANVLAGQQGGGEEGKSPLQNITDFVGNMFKPKSVSTGSSSIQGPAVTPTSNAVTGNLSEFVSMVTENDPATMEEYLKRIKQKDPVTLQTITDNNYSVADFELYLMQALAGKKQATASNKAPSKSNQATAGDVLSYRNYTR